jgi:hypothetical protein
MLSFRRAFSTAAPWLSAVSPIDGRYAAQAASLGRLLSEKALMQQRIVVEVKWFEFLSKHKVRHTRGLGRGCGFGAPNRGWFLFPGRRRGAAAVAHGAPSAKFDL